MTALLDLGHQQLTAYLGAVATEVGVRPESVIVHAGSACLWLDRRVATHPGRDAALLWDPQHGWSLAVETHSGEDLIVLRYLGGALCPSPRAVAGFTTAARHGLPVGHPDPPTSFPVSIAA
ncbi:DUF6292 family protein [Actinokineospora diospyrosa]|uniref:DUF6292 domain-containing protein n=1 Tax=Actinokineospora diospyrosa TaxID=103728 RepID=A0ABT1IFD9_9PSEU|nr:DUF6292 family protein [Actinokineospora diospyrosa]MCP2271293.1 hypothetical protein [Actinokineospora diospyrosa]